MGKNRISLCRVIDKSLMVSTHRTKILLRNISNQSQAFVPFPCCMPHRYFVTIIILIAMHFKVSNPVQLSPPANLTMHTVQSSHQTHYLSYQENLSDNLGHLPPVLQPFTQQENKWTFQTLQWNFLLMLFNLMEKFYVVFSEI